MNELNLLGLLFMAIGSVAVFLLNYNAGELDKARFIKWMKKPKIDGSLNFKFRWSKLDKKILLAYSVFFIGVFLQVAGYFYDKFS